MRYLESEGPDARLHPTQASQRRMLAENARTTLLSKLADWGVRNNQLALAGALKGFFVAAEAILSMESAYLSLALGCDLPLPQGVAPRLSALAALVASMRARVSHVIDTFASASREAEQAARASLVAAQAAAAAAAPIPALQPLGLPLAMLQPAADAPVSYAAPGGMGIDESLPA